MKGSTEAKKERVLGRDYVVLKGRGDRDIYNGATVEGDEFVRLGIMKPMQGSETACGKPIKEFMLTYSDVEIDCPECVKVLTKKRK